MSFFVIVFTGCTSKSSLVINNYLKENNINNDLTLKKQPIHMYKLGVKLLNKGFTRDALTYLQKAYSINPEDNNSLEYFPGRELGIAFFLMAKEKYAFMDKGFNLKESTPNAYLALRSIRSNAIKSRQFLSKCNLEQDNRANSFHEKANYLLQEITGHSFDPSNETPRVPVDIMVLSPNHQSVLMSAEYGLNN